MMLKYVVPAANVDGPYVSVNQPRVWCRHKLARDLSPVEISPIINIKWQDVNLDACRSVHVYWVKAICWALFRSNAVNRSGFVFILSNYQYASLQFSAIFLFSSPEHKVLKVSFCDGPLSVVCASTISLNNFFSETTHWTLTKLHRNDP